MPTKYLEIETEEQWLALRALDITSTESAALFGLSPYNTELELFYRKSTGERAEFADNARMKAGRFLEPSIAELAGDELGCVVKPFKVYARDPDARFGSSFDYKVTSGQYDDWILEVKNVDFLVYRDQWEDDEAPDHIEVQVQHQLELTGRPGAIIACLVGGNDLRLIHRERNEKMGAGIRRRIERFWTDVRNAEPPEPDYLRDADFIIGLHQMAGEEVFDATSDVNITTLLADYKRLKTEAKDLDDLAKAKKAEVLSIVGDDVGRVIADGYTLACTMTKTTPPTVITEEMVGQTYGGRKGFRNFRVTEKKQ